jgi:fibronectin-binding autotransporter adhesin
MWRFTSRVFKRLFTSSAHRAPATQRVRPATSKPLLELLEDRTVPSVFTPTTFADGTGAGTLRNAIVQANSNGQDNTIVLATGTYTLSAAAGGELALTGVNHAHTIQSSGQTIITAGNGSRVFELIGNVQVTLANLTITGGMATDSGSIGGADARGGGLLVNGGNVTLQGVVTGNEAQAGPDHPEGRRIPGASNH